MAACPDEVAELIERFEGNRQMYLASAYNEAQVRRDFIDPLFLALGWDVDNRQGLAGAYKGLIHEGRDQGRRREPYRLAIGCRPGKFGSQVGHALARGKPRAVSLLPSFSRDPFS
jgi:hypothetical protein